MDKEMLKKLYDVAQEIMEDCPDEADCTDAENEVLDEVANLIQAIKNSKLI